MSLRLIRLRAPSKAGEELIVTTTLESFMGTVTSVPARAGGM
jgi:hypothetical protein